MSLKIIHKDITKLQVDAIVNLANPELCRGGGVSSAIFVAAGERKLQKACKKLDPYETGQAGITKGFALPAKYVIHTVGPVWRGGHNGERNLLYSCYQSSLSLARAHGCQSIAFPLIYGYPKDQALQTASAAIEDFLLHYDMAVTLAVFDQGPLVLSGELYYTIKTFIDNNYVEFRFDESDDEVDDDDEDDFDVFDTSDDSSSLQSMKPPAFSNASSGAPMPLDLYNAVSCLDESFSLCLLRLIDEKKLPDTEVYKRANIDRRLFSKIRSNPAYQPSKHTVIAFAIALELSMDETCDLLMKAGYALSRSSKLDVIVEYFISIKNYNVFEINQALFAFGQGLLGE